MLPQDWTLFRAVLASDSSVSVNSLQCFVLEFFLVFLRSWQPIPRTLGIFSAQYSRASKPASGARVCKFNLQATLYLSSVFTLRGAALRYLQCVVPAQFQRIVDDTSCCLPVLPSLTLLVHSSGMTFLTRWCNVSNCSFETVKGTSLRGQYILFPHNDWEFPVLAWTRWGATDFRTILSNRFL
jgi:hypothetical protein